MHRFYLPPNQVHGDFLRLSDSDARHASTVLRLATGDEILVLDGAGQRILSTVEHVGKREVSARVRSREMVSHSAHQVVLLQAVAKSAAMDGLIHRAVELGCHRIVPLITERSVSRPDDPQSKQEKWQTIAIEALKQCGAPWLTRVEKPVSLEAWLAQHEAIELSLVGSLEDSPQHLKSVFESYRKAHGRNPRQVGIYVGPEGDFSSGEYAALRAHGAIPITLGPLILRVETAATAVLAILNHELAAP